jgi:hypothetical protein
VLLCVVEASEGHVLVVLPELLVSDQHDVSVPNVNGEHVVRPNITHVGPRAHALSNMWERISAEEIYRRVVIQLSFCAAAVPKVISRCNVSACVARERFAWTPFSLAKQPGCGRVDFHTVQREQQHLMR